MDKWHYWETSALGKTATEAVRDFCRWLGKSKFKVVSEDVFKVGKLKFAIRFVDNIPSVWRITRI